MFVSADQWKDSRSTATISMSGLSLIVGSTPICDNLPAVTRSFLCVREEQVPCIVLGVIVYRLHFKNVLSEGGGESCHRRSSVFRRKFPGRPVPCIKTIYQFKIVHQKPAAAADFPHSKRDFSFPNSKL